MPTAPTPVPAPLRLAHLADLHLAARPRRGEWTVRRTLGYAHWVLRRHRRHPARRLHAAVESLAADPPDLVLLSGDVGQLGLSAEYERARGIFAPLSKLGVPVLMVGGNHDRYGRHPVPAWDKLCRDLRLDIPVDDLGVAHAGGADILLCDQARAGGWIGSWGQVPPGLTARLAREWRRPAPPAPSAPASANRTEVAAPAAALLRLALGHYPLRLPNGRALPRWYGLRGAEGWPALLDACGVVAYFCGHLHKRYSVDLTACCRQYCVGSVTAGGGVDRYIVAGGRLVAAAN